MEAHLGRVEYDPMSLPDTAAVLAVLIARAPVAHPVLKDRLGPKNAVLGTHLAKQKRTSTERRP